MGFQQLYELKLLFNTSHKILKFLVKNLVKISLSGHNSTQDNAEASRFEFAIGQHNSFAFATE